MMMARRRMTGRQFNEHLIRLGFTQVEFARTIEVNARTVRHWVAGSYPVPRVVALLVALMIESKINSDDLK